MESTVTSIFEGISSATFTPVTQGMLDLVPSVLPAFITCLAIYKGISLIRTILG